MKNMIRLSMVSVMAIASLHAANPNDGVSTKLKHGEDAKVEVTNAKEVNNLESMFANGKVSGQIRTFYIDRKYEGTAGKDLHRDATAIGGHLKYETAEFNGVKLGAAGYTTHDVDLNQHGIQDPSLLGTDYDSYSILGEAYLAYSFANLGSKSDLKLGLQRYDSAMMGSDDTRMLPTTFEAYKFTNKDIDNLTINITHINKIAYGTFSNIYSGGGIIAATSGYSARGVNTSSTGIETGKYYNMGEATVGKNTDGVLNTQLMYKADNFHVKVSNDYAFDLYNTLYAETGISWKCLLTDSVKPFFKAQIIKQDSVGGDYMKYSSIGGNGDIDSLFWAGKFGAKYAGLTAYIAYSETTDNNSNDASYKNAIITQFGGMPAYTQGMVTRHQFLAGTKATKVAASYSFKEQGLNLSAAAYYSSFDMDENSGYGVARTAYEPGFDIKYYPSMVKNLQLRVRANFPRKFAESTTGDTGWDEYRFIMNYNF